MSDNAWSHLFALGGGLIAIGVGFLDAMFGGHLGHDVDVALVVAGVGGLGIKATATGSSANK